MSFLAHTLSAGLVLALMSQPVSADEMAAKAVRTILSTTEAPGVAVAAMRDGQVETAFGGLRAFDQDVAVGAEDLWHIGSNAKAMTATLVARLVEAGEISWDDTVGEVLGEAIPGMNAAYRNVTYVELLSHRARVQANIGRLKSLGLAGSLASRDVRADRLAYAEAVLTQPPEGEGFLYSNAGYVIVGTMLEAEMDEAWEVLIRTHVATPLGMSTVGFGAPGSSETVDQPRGHYRSLLGKLKAVAPGPGSDNIPAMGPAGTLHLSVADMMRFLEAHATGNARFLSAESWARLHQPIGEEGYAMGWRAEGACLAHSGSNTLWYAEMLICPEKKRAAFVAVNLGDIDALAEPLAAVASTLLAD
jgi:D-alanyl-D-alanine carboxypeptidase